MERTIIIGGGVGPMAGVDLHRQIILHTKTNGTDQDHINVVHLSYASLISDRTDYLLGTAADHPGHAMAQAVEAGFQAAQQYSASSVAGVPCNTFHASEIFDPYEQLLSQTCPDLVLVHMLRETIAHMQEIAPDLKRAGLYSTTGTRNSRVWHALLEERGIEVVEVPEELQDRLHQDIYHPKWGVKAISKTSDRVKNDFDGFSQMLLQDNAEAIILGCTELSMVFPENVFLGIPVIDPMTALARALIREANPSKLRPLQEIN